MKAYHSNIISGFPLAIGQGVYFFAAGLWPLVNLRSFIFITGPKTDIWLVDTVGILLAVIGLVLLTATIRKNISTEVVLLATGSSASLAGIEFFYVIKGQISAVYLLDAVIEIALVGLWGIVWVSKRGIKT